MNLDRATRILAAKNQADQALRKIDKAIARSPRAIAQDTLAWLEQRAADGELAPGGLLADYPVSDVVKVAYGPSTGPLRR